MRPGMPGQSSRRHLDRPRRGSAGHYSELIREATGAIVPDLEMQIAPRSTDGMRSRRRARACRLSIKGVRIAGAVLGVLLVGAVWVNVAVTLVIPRGRIGFIKSSTGS
jgi:hypothetical protein